MADLDDDTKNLKDQFINYRENIDKLETDFRALIKSQRDLNEVKKNQIIQKNREHIGRISQSTHKFHLSEFEKKEKNYEDKVMAFEGKLQKLKDAHSEFLSALETGDKDKINECWAKLKDAHDELLSARNELIDAGNEINTQKHSSIENGQQR